MIKLKAGEFVEFTYKDKKGKVSDRAVFILSPASDKAFGIDLSEYTEEEREYYLEALRELMEEQQDRILELGLKSNYRFFFEKEMEIK